MRKKAYRPHGMWLLVLLCSATPLLAAAWGAAPDLPQPAALPYAGLPSAASTWREGGTQPHVGWVPGIPRSPPDPPRSVARRATTTYISTDDETTFAANLVSNTTIDLTGNITVSAATGNAVGGGYSAFAITGVTNLKINGNGYSIKFASSDSGNGRLFYISGGSDVEMNGVTLENGYVYSTSAYVYGGAINLDSSTLTMNSCTITGNTAQVRAPP